MNIKSRIYSGLYKWALKQWRKSEQLPNIGRKKGSVTAHALMRYAERIDGYDFEAAEQKILTPEVVEYIGDIGGTGKFTMNGILYTCKNGYILTIAKPAGNKENLVLQSLDGSTGRKWSF